MTYRKARRSATHCGAPAGDRSRRVAARQMAATVTCANELKALAGVRAGGRRVERVVKGGVASNTVAKSSDRPAIVTRPRAMPA